MIEAGQPILASDLAIPITAGEALSVRDAVYIDAVDGKAYKCDADDLTKIGFAGFVLVAAAANAATSILPDGILGGFSGLTVGSYYYISTTAGAITATKPANYKIVAQAVTSSIVKIYRGLTVRTRTYETVQRFGGTSSQFDIKNPSGTTFRYTFDLTGYDPLITSSNPTIGTILDIQAAGFAAGNKGIFVVTGSGTNYFEVTNVSGVVESNKTIGGGYIAVAYQWQKPAGLLYIDIEVQGGGASGDSDSSTSTGGGGGGGGYSKKRLYASELGATEYVTIGNGGVWNVSRFSGGNSSFGSHATANGAVGQGGGAASGGDINITGGDGGGGAGTSGSSGGLRQDFGGQSFLGHFGIGTTSGGLSAIGYGAGGGGGETAGGSGGQGIVIVTEYY